MKIGVYQGHAVGKESEHAFAVIEDTLKAASSVGTDIVVFPELFIPGYNQPDLHRALAQPSGGEWEQRFASLAATHSCGLVIGWAEKDGEKIFNTASAYDASGAKIGHYRKIQLFGAIEKSVFEFGDSYCTFDIAGTKVGLLICYDIEFAQHTWALRELGADLLLIPTANPIDFDNVPDLLVPARATENGMVIAYANYCGSEGNVTYGGKSVIVDGNGAVIAQAGRCPTLLIADLAQIVQPLSTQHQDYRDINRA